MTDRIAEAVLARRRTHRDRIVLNSEAAERLRIARATLDLLHDNAKKETS